MKLEKESKTMDKDKRKGWLKQLKVGDKVIVHKYGYVKIDYISVIEKITPTGRITISIPSQITFDPEGREIGKYHSGLWYLMEATQDRLQEVRAKQKKRTLVWKIDEAIKNFCIDGSLEDLEAVANIVSKYKKD
jgi:hypothetical protein